jgi:hypothetical protein
MQYNAVNDPRLNNSIVAANYEIDEAVTAGAMSAEDGALLKDFNSQGLTQFIKRNPETGKVEFDWDALDNMGNGDGSDSGSVKAPEGSKYGDTFSQGDALYVNKGEQGVQKLNTEYVLDDSYDPFGADLDLTKAIITSGDKTSEYYKTAMTKIERQIKTNPSSVPITLLADNENLYNYVKGSDFTSSPKPTQDRGAAGLGHTDGEGLGKNYYTVSGIPQNGNAYVNLDAVAGLEGGLYYIGTRQNEGLPVYDRSHYQITNVKTGKTHTLTVDQQGVRIDHKTHIGSTKDDYYIGHS